ncbi:hypothetical protein [uncultured Friedmanniella sp.]|uniref:hypothetical protein n=1 Tax=uncultured Friedmanniella sp. TaxID=335381 RepID=UPI0035CCA9AA
MGLVAIVVGSIPIALALWRSHAVAGSAAAEVGLGGATLIVIGILGQSVLGADVGHVVVARDWSSSPSDARPSAEGCSRWATTSATCPPSFR